MSKRLLKGGVPVVVLLFALTACSGNEPAQPQQGNTAQDSLLQYAQCMRDNGVQLADPQPDNPGAMYQGVDKDSAAFVAANKTCGHFLDGVVQERQNQDSGDQAQQDEEMLALAKCLREKGIDVPDPVPGSDTPFGDKLDRTDPATSKALKECQTAAAPSQG
uniref:QmnJ n=1 Tax=Amycolatopsis orientalis TaxID=31958 RepID=K4FDK3_AMYOR|nr:QmnJ [Amycolatopsis orientalis]